MRILLVTGKGGVGKTTVAAATAVRAADGGARTLIMSTDPAHSLGDAFDTHIGAEPTEILPGLHAQQIDAQRQLETFWKDIHDQLMAVFNWGGVDGIAAEEFLVFPGMDELFALLEVKEQANSGLWDLLVVDCAPTAETLRLLSLPEVLSWYFERVLPTERRIMRAARPVLSRVTKLPMPGEEVFDAAESVFAGVEEVKALLADPEVTAARLVVNPEKMVVAEARRTYTYLGFFGYAVDAVVVNRVLPDEVHDPYFDRWRTVQRDHLATIEESFEDVEVITLRLFDEEMVGVDRLRLVGGELYGETDPIGGFVGRVPFSIVEQPDAIVMELSIPFATKDELDVVRRGNEITITVGQYRRSFVLPDTLQRRRVEGAKLEGGKLGIRFVEGADE
jgi:arsenite-transporting ATPase